MQRDGLFWKYRDPVDLDFVLPGIELIWAITRSMSFMERFIGKPNESKAEWHLVMFPMIGYIPT